MKLYYCPGACSLTQHILLCMSGLDFTLERVDLKTHETEHKRNFFDINPRGQVPTLELDDGNILTENIAIAQYIADKAPTANLLAPIGNNERYQTISWLSFVGTELFHTILQSKNETVLNALKTKLTYINNRLKNHHFIATDHFTIADAYLYVILTWRKYNTELPEYPAIDNYMQRIEKFPEVKKALMSEK